MTNLNLIHLLSTTSFLFFIGLIGLVLNRKNIIITIMSLEILLLAINFNFIIFSLYLDDILGHIFVLFILTVAGAESAIGLALLIKYYSFKSDIRFENIVKKQN